MLVQAKTCFCLKLTQNQKRRGSGKGNAPFTHISTLPKEKNGSYARKAKGKETVVLPSSEFLGEIKAYLLGLIQADCCVTVRGEATSWRGRQTGHVPTQRGVPSSGVKAAVWQALGAVGMGCKVA